MQNTNNANNDWFEDLMDDNDKTSDLPFDSDSENFKPVQIPEEQFFTELPETMRNCLDKCIDFLVSNGASRERIENTQKPIIEQVLLAYINNRKCFILEAPTGSGKSIMAFIINHTIAAYHHRESQVGYILTSSKSLQEQMINDARNFGLNRFKLLKGQGNYICDANGKPFPKRDCEHMSMSKAFEKKKCGPTCKYLIDRFAAINSETAIFSYAYFLTSMNFVFNSIGGNAPFLPRIVTIFDECHTLSDVLQSMFMVQITNKFASQIDNVQQCLLNIVNTKNMETIDSCASLADTIKDFVDEFFTEKSMAELMTDIEQMSIYLKDYVMLMNSCIPEEHDDDEPNIKKIASNSEKLMNLSETMRYFVANNKDQLEWVVCKHESDGMYHKMTLQTLLDDVLFKRHVEPFSQFSVLMSATIGDIPQYAKTLGIEDYEYAYMPSDFNFDRSPIYHVEPNISLAMKNKADSMPILMERMMYICEQIHPNERGIIHTGNFEIARKFKEYVQLNSSTYRRYMFYDNSEQKELIIKNLERTHNGVIIGPSLIEGIDLKDDLARFCILAKVQYPNLDIFNKKRLQLIPGWYDWKTFTSFLQSIGRVIRHKDDYAVTYLMDSCFKFLFKKCELQGYISKRIKKFDISQLMYKENLDDLFDY